MQPNHVQIMVYCVVRSSAVSYDRGHRDNFKGADFTRLASGTPPTAGFANGAGENSQAFGSDVLVYTHGTAPMRYEMRCCGVSDLGGTRRPYPMREVYCMELKRGRISILRAPDDIAFVHMAKFEVTALVSAAEGGYRMGFVMRWLERKEYFYLAPRLRNGMVTKT